MDILQASELSFNYINHIKENSKEKSQEDRLEYLLYIMLRNQKKIMMRLGVDY